MSRDGWRLNLVSLLVRVLVLGSSLLASAGIAVGARAQDSGETPPGLTYVALGASDATGVGAESSLDGWVPRFASLLGTETRLVNLGVSGSLLRQALDEQLPLALAANPEIVTVWLVVNDFNEGVPLDDYARDLQTLLRELTAGTHARVLLANVPDLTLVPNYADRPTNLLAFQIAHWNATIARVAARHDVRLIDLYAPWQELATHPEYISEDRFHPSASGYARIAQLFLAAVALEDEAAP